MKDSILIIGGAGYIGSHTLKALNLNYDNLICYDNLSTGRRENVRYGKFIEGDICDIKHLNSIFSKYRFNSVIHFAANASVSESVLNPSKYYINNTCNTIKLLEVMKNHDTKQIIFSSSCATYGIPQNNPICETHPQKPINPYGKSKLMVETILEDYRKAYGIQYGILRYFNAAGADPNGEIGENHFPETHLIPLILDSILDGRNSVSVYGNNYKTHDGTCIRDYIHVSDIANAHVLTLEALRSDMKSMIYNIGIGHGYSIYEVIQTIEIITGHKIKVMNEKRRRGDPAILIADSKKIQKELGWKPLFTSLQCIIESAFKWHKNKN